MGHEDGETFVEPGELVAGVELLVAKSEELGVMATLMLEGGADVRLIQEILGQAELSTTEIYTRVNIKYLKAVHTATHPGANFPGRAWPRNPGPREPTVENTLTILDAEARRDEPGQ